jgi:peptide/nickel transport system substrate-binding protein
MCFAMLLAVVPVAACGGSDRAENRTRTGAADTAGAKKGGDVTFLSSSDVDHIDPGQVYSAFGYMVHYAVNRTLYSYKAGNSEDAVPDLAAGPPKISPDRRSITVRLRTGVRFSPPVEREVTSKDIKYAFERAFTKEVPFGYE